MSFKRRVLSALGKDVLLEIGRGLELDVTTRMGVEELRDALAKSKRAKLDAIVQASLSRDTLKEICGAVGLDDTGKEKAALVERILAAGGEKTANGSGYKIDPSAVTGSRAAEGGGALGALLSGLDAVPASRPTKARGKTKKDGRRRGGVPESAAVIAGTLKAALQQFALGAAGGYGGGDAHVAFTTHLLECFGWLAGRPDSAAIPHTFAIADAGKRVEREVALWWSARRTLLEVAAHDAGLDFAWKDLLRICLQLDPVPQYVVLTNQRDLQLYDLARDREAPRLAIRIDDLPKYSEAFPFFNKEWTPGAVPKIVNVEKVSEDVADLVARLYRSVRAQHPGREKDVIRLLLSRMREFPSTAGKLSWNGGISAANFYGIDINPFTVELAKVTLNIAKKIAFEERKAQAFALAGQVEMDIDPSLPLDNLDKNIVCADALFTDWPEVDAIVGNPPMLGGRKIRSELGAEYLQRVRERFHGVDSRGDFCCYWFRLAHERLSATGRAGLIGTSGVRIGNAREATLDYITASGGTITNAVSSRVWPGDASINVSMVNWTRGTTDGPNTLIIEDQTYQLDRIPTHLQLFADLSPARTLRANSSGSSMGATFGHPAFTSRESSFPADVAASAAIRPLATANDLLRDKLDGECIWLAESETEAEAKARGGVAFEYLKQHVYTLVKERADSGKETDDYKHWLKSWWKAQKPRQDFFNLIRPKQRFVVSPRSAARPVFVFLSAAFVPNPILQLYAFDDDYSFGILQSIHHWRWIVGKGTRVREDFTYTSEVWRTFPWPQDPTDEQVAAVAVAACELRRERARLRVENGWSLRQLHQAAAVEGSHPLKDAQAALDAAVTDAYGMPPDQGSTEFLLELNQLVAEDEEQGRKVRGPGLPDHLDPKDPRWFSTDCIEPPPVGS